MNEWKPLTGVVRADAAVVGGGWTGLMTASALSGAGLRVAVVDAGQPLREGPSALCAHPWAAYARIAESAGMEAAREHARRLQRVCRGLPGLLAPLTDFREAERYRFALLEGDLPALRAYTELAESLGLAAWDAPDAGGCPFPVERSALSRDTLLIGAEGLREGLVRRIRRCGGRVLGDSLVTEVASGRVFTESGRVDAPVVILTCGRPPGLRRVTRFTSLTVARCRLTGGPPLFTVQQSVRPGHLTLLPIPGGLEAALVAGRTGSRAENGELARFRRILRARLPDSTPDEMRLGQLAAPVDGLPMIGESAAYPGRTLLACGVTTFAEAALAAGVLTHLLTGRPHPPDALYAPDRPLPAGIARGSLRRLRTLRALNSLRRGAPRCSLCACRLRWCEGAQWWGCPVCGSAFGLLGRRLSGPALRDARASARQRPGW